MTHCHLPPPILHRLYHIHLCLKNVLSFIIHIKTRTSKAPRDVHVHDSITMWVQCQKGSSWLSTHASCCSSFCTLGRVFTQAAEGRTQVARLTLCVIISLTHTSHWRCRKYIFIKLCHYEDSNEHFHVGGYFLGGPLRGFVLAPVSSIFICHL